MPQDGRPSRVAAGPARRRRFHALELVLARPDDEAVRQRWARLEEVGLPSAARHTGVTHRPHVTVVSGPRPRTDVLRAAAALVGPLLPLTLAVNGLVRLGPPSRTTLVEALEPSDALRAARDRLTELWTGADERPWLAHVTLAQRLSPEATTTALAALGARPGPATSRRAVGLRWWDPDEGTVTTVAGEDP